MNAFALIWLQKKIADELDVKIGTYTHRANSFHAYERDFEALDSFAMRYLKNEDMTYSYWDDWKYQMEEARDEIAAKVAELKGEEA